MSALLVLLALGALVASLVLGAARYRKETVPDCLRALWAGITRVLADVRELEERRALLLRPWEEELLHWSYDGRQWQLHGHRTPPSSGSGHGVTAGGWCLGREKGREYFRAL